ncbi:MAG: hypothetical protein KDK59_06980 [Simkania sp.]|nr:hypothetical protein [Simkania sp.]
MEVSAVGDKNWADLPNEIYAEILDQLPIHDIIRNVPLVDKTLYRLTKIHSIDLRVKIFRLFESLLSNPVIMNRLYSIALELLQFSRNSLKIADHYENINNFIVILARMDVEKTLHLIDRLERLTPNEKAYLKVIAMSESNPEMALEFISNMPRVNRLTVFQIKGLYHLVGTIAVRDPKKAIMFIRENKDLNELQKDIFFKRIMAVLALTDPKTAKNLAPLSKEFECLSHERTDSLLDEVTTFIHEASLLRQGKSNLEKGLEDNNELLGFVTNGLLFD